MMRNPDGVYRLWLRARAPRQLLQERARREGWVLEGDQERAHDEPSHCWWRTPGGARVGWYEDHGLGVPRVWVQGDAALASALRAQLPCWSREELIERAEGREPRAALQALRTLACMEQGALEEDTRAQVLRWMTHSDEVMRRAVARLIWSGQWSELAPAVRAQIPRDPALEETLEGLALGLEALVLNSVGEA